MKEYSKARKALDRLFADILSEGEAAEIGLVEFIPHEQAQIENLKTHVTKPILADLTQNVRDPILQEMGYKVRKPILSRINKLEKTSIEQTGFRKYKELFGRFLVTGLMLLLLEVLLSNTILKVRKC